VIRERRNKEKLMHYYYKFINDGVLDPNVHPWVAESWQRSRQEKIASDIMRSQSVLSRQELAARQAYHKKVIDYLDGLFQEVREHFNVYNLSMILVDHEYYCLKSYALPFVQKAPGAMDGMRLSEADIGTSSISLSVEHRVPFLLFGPEMWVEECHSGDAFSAPIFVNGEMEYVLTLVSVHQEELPYTAFVSLVLSMKYALEKHLAVIADLEAREALLDSTPVVAYHILPNGEVKYANRAGRERLAISDDASLSKPKNLSEFVLNYQHTPIFKGFKGIPAHNKEVTWITAKKTYEDITTVTPLYTDQEVNSVVAVSTPIEGLRMLVAHASGYKARYSLSSMVGNTPVFLSMMHKASRAANSGHNILLQGESGTGKQRLAHGIHQAGTRAAGPLIAVKCGDFPPELLETELFGLAGSSEENAVGKLELANGGTLFLDEVEKIPLDLAARLARVLTEKQICSSAGQDCRPLDVRVIAACDGDLKRLTEKQQFSSELYPVISRTFIRIPPLRSRREDIPLLAEHIVVELAEQHQMPVKRIAKETAEALLAYEWPDNVKQLQGVVEYAFFHTVEDVISPGDIHLPGRGRIGMAWKEDRGAFLEIWKAARGNISRMANMLAVSRVTLYRYLRKYGLEK